MAGVVNAFNADCSGAAGYVALFAVTLLLALVSLSLGAMVALVAQKRGRALSPCALPLVLLRVVL
jgi:hypothetical protein